MVECNSENQPSFVFLGYGLKCGAKPKDIKTATMV